MKMYLTTNELSEYLALAPQILRIWRMTGEGPPFKKLGIKRQAPVRYKISDIEAWIDKVNSESNDHHRARAETV